MLKLVALGLGHIDAMGLEGFEDFEPMDMQEVVNLYFLEDTDAVATEAAVKNLLATLRTLLVSLDPEREEEIDDGIRQTLQSYYSDGDFISPLQDAEDGIYDELGEGEEDPFLDLSSEAIDGIVSKLLDEIQAFFRSPVYHLDLQRAMLLYFGPVRMQKSDPENDGMLTRDLQAFWDFFLFDYHTVVKDKLPLRVFYEAKKADLDGGELRVLRDLLHSTFTVFYIEHLEGDSALCRDIFTDEEMDLPRPETDGHDPRKTLLFGHVHAGGVMLLNYITIVPATAALRRRIKGEIERLYEIYRIQAPEATMQAFFARHAAAVRHVILQMTSYAQLTIVPNLAPVTVVAREKLPEALQRPAALLDEHAKALAFSAYERKALQRLYQDVIVLSGMTTAGAGDYAFLAATTLYFAIQNVKDIGDVDTFFQRFHTQKQTAVERLTYIFSALGMQHPDPRYLTEFGFVNLLFRVPDPAPYPLKDEKGVWPL